MSPKLLALSNCADMPHGAETAKSISFGFVKSVAPLSLSNAYPHMIHNGMLKQHVLISIVSLREAVACATMSPGVRSLDFYTCPMPFCARRGLLTIWSQPHDDVSELSPVKRICR